MSPKRCSPQSMIILLIFTVLTLQYFNISTDVTFTSTFPLKPTSTYAKYQTTASKYVSTNDHQLNKQDISFSRVSVSPHKLREVLKGPGLDKQDRKWIHGMDNDKDLYRFREHQINLEETLMFEEHMRRVLLLDTRTVRNYTCDSCFNYPFKYIITGDEICGQRPYLDLIFLITTAHTHLRKRQILRNTWLTHSKHSTGVRYAFLLGDTPNIKLRESLQAENEMYKDIVMVEFNDTYLNLTYKTVAGLRWVTEMCPHARYVMKTDDDIFVNVPELLSLLHSKFLQDNLNRSVMGSCFNITKPNRDENSKYFASLSSYPHFYYPPFCSGTGYVMSMRTAQEVYKMTRNVPFFHLEDVYIGMCLKQLGFGIFNYFGFAINIRRAKQACYFKKKKIVSVHTYNQSDIELLWDSNFCNYSRTLRSQTRQRKTHLLRP